MQLSHVARVRSARFDDPREHLSVPGGPGCAAGAKVSALVAGMVAGADSIDDMDLLRHGAMSRLFVGVRAPSTLGTFLRAFATSRIDDGGSGRLAKRTTGWANDLAVCCARGCRHRRRRLPAPFVSCAEVFEHRPGIPPVAFPMARAGAVQPVADRQRSRAIARALARSDRFDIALQFQTMSAPPTGPHSVPYVIYTDNTMALTRRFYPDWAPLLERRAQDWMRIEAQVCQNADLVFTMSEFARRSVIEDYHCDPDRVLSVGAGANMHISRPAQRAGAAQPRALFVGIDFARKGGETLLRAWGLIQQRIPTAVLTIAGPVEDPRRTSDTGVVWEGPVSRGRLSALYSDASLFLLPSLFEPFGLVLLEAMAHGLPCIGSASCAMPEIIADGVTGRLVAPGEAEPLADAIVELLGAPEVLGRMSEAAYARFLTHGTWPVWPSASSVTSRPETDRRG